MKTILIKNGTVYDGLGGEPYCADLLLRDGHVAAIGSCETEADLVIDAAGKVGARVLWIFTATVTPSRLPILILAAWNWRRASPPRWWETAASA